MRGDRPPHDPQLRATILLRLGSVLAALGDGVRALARHQEAFDLATDVGDQRLMTHALLEIGCDRVLVGEANHGVTEGTARRG